VIIVLILVKMLIVGCNKTSETTEQLNNLLPNDLKNTNILLNIGYSKFKETDYKDYLILNTTESIKNCLDKKLMFKILKKNQVKCLKYFDLNKNIDKVRTIFYLLLNKELVLRNEKSLKVINFKEFKEIFNKKWKYSTLKENKLIEYRIIVFKNRIVRAMIKLNTSKDFQIKQENSKFIDIDINKLPKKVLKNIFKAVNSLKIDLSGIDILINKKGKFKIIEVNSGMSLCSKSIKRFYDILRYYLFLER